MADRWAHPAFGFEGSLGIRILLCVGLVLLIGGSVLHIVAGYSAATPNSEHAVGLDDAYISFRYAQNLVEGNGLVFNPGDRLEGFSNLLLVLVAAALLLVVEPENLYFAIGGFNLVVMVALWWLFHGHLRRTLGATSAALGALLFALTPVFWAWTATGMESVLVVAIQLALWISVDRLSEQPDSNGRLTILVGVVVLCVTMRADGFLFPMIAVVHFVLRGQPRLALRTGVVTGIALAGLFAWRYGYYGDVLPNTYYAKVAGPLLQRLEHGASQAYRLSLSTGLLPYALAVLAPAIPALREAVRSLRAGKLSSTLPLKLPFPTLFAACLVGYYLFIGGDHFGERFLLVLFPMGIAALLELVRPIRSRALLGWGVATLLLLQCSPLAYDARFSYTGDRYDCWVTLGQYLEANFPDRTLAIGAAGKVPYFSGLETVDMRGLVDRHIARVPVTRFQEPGHDKIDPDYVLSREPDLIAAFITNPNFDLAVGLSRRLYEGAGYRLRLMVNSLRSARDENVVDVRHLDRPARLRLLQQGHWFAVLERVE